MYRNKSIYMKKLIILIAVMYMSILVNAQSKNDPSYSAHNYKHPNKAEYAKEHNLDKNLKLNYERGDRNLSVQNYKRQDVGAEKQSGATVPITKIENNRNGFNSKRNYKSQF